MATGGGVDTPSVEVLSFALIPMTEKSGRFKPRQGSGDDGFTDFPGGVRISKNSAGVRACAAIDQANCMLGLCRAEISPGDSAGLKPFIPEIIRIQKSLIYAGAAPAGLDYSHSPSESYTSAQDGAAPARLDYSRRLVLETERMDKLIRVLSGKLPGTSGFVTPGDTKNGALLHCARAACRTAETLVAGLPGTRPAAVYLNRVSDFLFLLARLADINCKKRK